MSREWRYFYCLWVAECFYLSQLSDTKYNLQHFTAQRTWRDCLSLFLSYSDLSLTWTFPSLFLRNNEIRKTYMRITGPGPKPLVPIPPRPNPNPVQPSSKPKLVPRGLGLTLKSWGPREKEHLRIGRAMPCLAIWFFILGDAINFMLTGSYSAGEAVDESYFEAQAKGQVSNKSTIVSQLSLNSFHVNKPQR